MLSFFDYTQFFIAMLAIVDPITILPLYMRLVRHFEPQQQKQMARQAAFSVTAALIITVFIGQKVLLFFGISLGAFQVAGGLLLLLVALQLMYSHDAAGSHLPGDKISSSEVVVPLAIPMLAGPGAFSTVIVYSYRSDEWIHWIILSGGLLILGAIVWLALHLSAPLMRHLSPTAISIVNKLMGLIMAAISVEFIANGIKALFTLA